MRGGSSPGKRRLSRGLSQVSSTSRRYAGVRGLGRSDGPQVAPTPHHRTAAPVSPGLTPCRLMCTFSPQVSWEPDRACQTRYPCSAGAPEDVFHSGLGLGGVVASRSLARMRARIGPGQTIAAQCQWVAAPCRRPGWSPVGHERAETGHNQPTSAGRASVRNPAPAYGSPLTATRGKGCERSSIPAPVSGTPSSISRFTPFDQVLR